MIRRSIEPWFDPAGPPFRVETWRIFYRSCGETLVQIRRPSRHGRRTGFGERRVVIDARAFWPIGLVVVALWLQFR